MATMPAFPCNPDVPLIDPNQPRRFDILEMAREQARAEIQAEEHRIRFLSDAETPRYFFHRQTPLRGANQYLAVLDDAAFYSSEQNEISCPVCKMAAEKKINPKRSRYDIALGRNL